MRTPSTACLLLLLVACGACGEEPPALEVDGIGYPADGLLGLSEDRKMLLGELTAFALAIAHGDTVELGRPIVERGRQEYLRRVMRAEEVLDSAGVDDAVLEARYREDPELELTVRHLIVLSGRYETDELRTEARRKAARALERIRAGEPFPEVAADISEEPGAAGREGLLPPGREGAWVDEFWTAAAALEPGEISGVVETEYGFHVVRLEERNVIPFEEARNRVVLDVAGMITSLRTPEPPPPPGLELREAVTRVLAERSMSDSATIAAWEGGRLTADELRRGAALLPRPEWMSARDTPDRARAVARGAAAWNHAADSARDLGIAVPDHVVASLERSWSDTLYYWSESLGLAGVASEAQVREAALGAFEAGGQNAGLVREAIHGRAPLLYRLYDIRLREPAGR